MQAIVLSYLLQFVLCYPAVLLASWPISALLSQLGFTGSHPGSVLFAGYEAIACLFAGPILGWCAGRVSPKLTAAGRWIWVIPVGLIFWDLASTALNGRGVYGVAWLPENLFATGDNEGIGVFFFTLPACSLAGYSVGISLAGKRLTWLTNPQNASLSAMAVVALFTALLLLAHNVERDDIDKW